MATIKPIEGRTVHQIQSGQVIVDLCSVVKELVENGLDAGATSIEVRFKNQGLEAIEVQDNGDGISANNYETLALKHYTSKLSTYADLSTLQTFGFRGEALSSLCALSKFSVVTCLAEDAPKGTKLEFEQSGALKGQSVVAAQKGTTVTVENLFHNLPVRKRELERNIKREWTRVVSILNQYACIQTGIKFSVSQQAGKGKKTIMFSTKGNPTTRENLVNIFGAKTLTALIAMDLYLELDPTSGPSQRWSAQEDGGKKEIRVIGHISRPAYGEGRQTPDRQMFYVNSRPCALPQVAKAFNEAYKAYNASQSPFILANIELDTHMYDVNVSPDKRTILLHDQTRMLENLKTALTKLFESQDYTVPIAQLPAQKQPVYKQLTICRDNSMASNGPARQSLRGKAQSTDDGESDDEPEPEQDVLSDDEGSTRSSRSKNASAISQSSLNKATGSISLISNWMDRKAEGRAEPEVDALKSDLPQENGLSKDKRLLIEKLRKESELAQAANEASEAPDSSATTTQSSQDPSPFHVRQRVADFNKRIAELQQPKQTAARDDDPIEDGEEEEPIPSLQSPAKPTPSIADRFNIAARIQRHPVEIATITIGGDTTISPVGSPAKRIRSMGPPNSSRSVAQRQTTDSSKPSFGSRLSQRFAAPGTAAEVDSEDEVDDVEETNDSSRLDEESTILEPSIAEESEEELDAFQSGVDLEKVGSPIPPTPGEDDFVDEEEQRSLEAARVKNAIRSAEENAQVLSQENAQRAKSILKGAKRKESTLDLVRTIKTSASEIDAQVQALQTSLSRYEISTASPAADDEGLDSAQAEERLSLTISKSDFAKMRVVGQFNLGFILATRASDTTSIDTLSSDDLFIIDQHASDEKYNFERLYATTVVQSQRLVTPKTLELTAMEEELVLEHQTALTKNGFILSFDHTGTSPVGSRCQLLSLPLSRETTFSLSDLEELLSLLADAPAGSVPRPSKVRKMLAMRACRSSVMIGKTLTIGGMEKLVRHLGELDKPWNCPHGRPTMRHLCGLGVWDGEGWRGDMVRGEGGVDEEVGRVNWGDWVERQKEEEMEVAEDCEE